MLSTTCLTSTSLHLSKHHLYRSTVHPARLPHTQARSSSNSHHKHIPSRMSACADCITGSLDEGAPKGQDSTIAGVPCYISKPEAAAANGCAVILATDIFGYQLINARLIADVYADVGYICVVPDYFQGEPMDMKLLENFESLPTQNFIGKITTGLQLVLQVINLGRWFQRHPFSHGVDVVTQVAAALKQEYGAKKVGLQGYCFGGTVGILMASKPGVLDAVCSAHPGKVTVPGDAEGITTPILFICAENDAQFPAKTRTAVQQILEDKQPGLSTFILYPGTQHGFAVRGNKRIPAVNAAREDALKQGIRFFGQHLAGVTPPAQRFDESAPAPVGKRLALAPRAC